MRTRSKGRQQFAVDISEVPFPPVQAYSEGQQFHFLKIVPGKSIIGFFPTTRSVPTKISLGVGVPPGACCNGILSLLE